MGDEHLVLSDRIGDNCPTEIAAVSDTQVAYATRPLPMAEGLARIALRNKLAQVAATESAEERERRSRAEADVVDAARRSQAEIRRHVDSYLKEHLETIVADTANVVIAQISDRVARGIAALQETQGFALDRIQADVRAQLRSFMRGSLKSDTAKKTQRGARAKAKAR